MRHFPWKELGYAAVAIVVLLVFYVGAYYALVEPRFVNAKILDDGRIQLEMQPAYRGGDFLGDGDFFMLMTSIDKTLRPDAWTRRSHW